MENARSASVKNVVMEIMDASIINMKIGIVVYVTLMAIVVSVLAVASVPIPLADACLTVEMLLV